MSYNPFLAATVTTAVPSPGAISQFNGPNDYQPGGDGGSGSGSGDVKSKPNNSSQGNVSMALCFDLEAFSVSLSAGETGRCVLVCTQV